MEGFLEANRVVEVSLTKLTKSNTELPLRKALLISKVLNTAQEAAESAHLSLVRSTTSRCSSKLLANMQARTVAEDVAVRELDVGHVRPWTSRPRTVSPMVTSQASARTNSDDMDFESVIYNNSVLSDILSSDENDMDITRQTTLPSSVEPSSTSTWESSGPLADVSNLRDWSCWFPESHSSVSDQRNSPPPSPGKRHHSLAFPSSSQETMPALFAFEVDSKRFKPSPPEGTPVEALPGFCEYLSPKNLCSAPLITYMFGKGFHSPSDPSISDWPSFNNTQEESNSSDEMWGHLLVSPSKLIMAC